MKQERSFELNFDRMKCLSVKHIEAKFKFIATEKLSSPLVLYHVI